jgi:hypothetical protein
VTREWDIFFNVQPNKEVVFDVVTLLKTTPYPLPWRKGADCFRKEKEREKEKRDNERKRDRERKK